MSCPQCGAIISPPSAESVQAPPPSTLVQPSSIQLEAPVGTKFKLSDLKIRPPTGEGKARRRYLRLVNRGLALHYVTPFTFWAGTACGVLASVLALNATLYEWDEVADAAVFTFRVSGVLLLLTGILALWATVQCLFSSSAVGRVFLLTSSGLLLTGCVSATVLTVSAVYGPTLFGVGVALLFVGWLAWMLFLRELAPLLHREEIAEGAGQRIWAGLRTLIVSPLALGVVGALIGMMAWQPGLITFIPATLVGALAAAAYHLGNFDSITAYVLAPTGILAAVEYLNFIGGLRLLLERRN
jgi:hypothetical protein